MFAITCILSFSFLTLYRNSKAEVLLDWGMLIPLVMMKMPCIYLAQSQALEVVKGPLDHLKLLQEGGAGGGAEAGEGAPAQ